jgi:hypothetical protein
MISSEPSKRSCSVDIHTRLFLPWSHDYHTSLASQLVFARILAFCSQVFGMLTHSLTICLLCSGSQTHACIVQPSLVTQLSYFARIIPPRRQPCCVILAGPTEIALKVDKIQLRLTCSRGRRRRRIPPRRPSTAAAPAVAADDTPDTAAAPVESHIGRLGKSRVRSHVVRYLLMLRVLRGGGLEQWRLMTIRRLLRR